jgi:hypothetical protein
MMTSSIFDFSAEAHADRIPKIGWQCATAAEARVHKSEDATWFVAAFDTASGHRVEAWFCIDASQGSHHISRVDADFSRMNKLLSAANLGLRFESGDEIAGAVTGVEIEIDIAHRGKDFPTPGVRGYRSVGAKP